MKISALFLLALLTACSGPSSDTPQSDTSPSEASADAPQSDQLDSEPEHPTDYAMVSEEPEAEFIPGEEGVPEGWESPNGLPHPSTILGQATGDLDKDGVDEKALVVGTAEGSADDFGYTQEVRIYRKGDGQWEQYYLSKGAVLPSESGGMMGNPFDGIEIKRGTLRISHFGGSSVKWTNTYIFRWQDNDFYLIGTDQYFGRPCDEEGELSANLSTGKVIYKLERQDCTTEGEPVTETVEETFTLDFNPLPALQDFVPQMQKIETPEHGGVIYW